MDRGMDPVTDPRELGVDPDGLGRLYARVAEGTDRYPECAAQVAVARHGRLAGFRTFGEAPFEGTVRSASDDALFAIFSVTKALTSSAAWILLQEGGMALDERVAERIPGFGSEGKQVVTVEHLLTHTAGLPTADMAPEEWLDPERRAARFASWRLEWEPGTRFVYHSGSGMWALAELITRASGVDYHDFVRGRVIEPLGLEDLYLGLPDALFQRVAEMVAVGEPMSEQESAASPVDAPTFGADVLDRTIGRHYRRVGTPGGGAIANAAAVAMFFQGILQDAKGEGAGIWRPEQLTDAWTVRNPGFVDPMTGHPALRGLGVVIAGPEGKMWRGLPELASPRTFGHLGAAGQIAWADPETGLSFAYCTNGAERNVARQGIDGFVLSTLAAECVAGAR